MATHTKDSILALIDSNDKAVGRAVVAIYRRQTQEERNAEATLKHNNVGFNSYDARYLSYVATYYMRHQQLTGKHLAKARSKVRKYWKQLLEIANDNQSKREVVQRVEQKTAFADWERQQEEKAFEAKMHKEARYAARASW